MLASVEYHDSTYAFAYGVLPSYRRMVRFSPAFLALAANLRGKRADYGWKACGAKAIAPKGSLYHGDTCGSLDSLSFPSGQSWKGPLLTQRIRGAGVDESHHAAPRMSRIALVSLSILSALYTQSDLMPFPHEDSFPCRGLESG